MTKTTNDPQAPARPAAGVVDEPVPTAMRALTRALGAERAGRGTRQETDAAVLALNAAVAAGGPRFTLTADSDALLTQLADTERKLAEARESNGWWGRAAALMTTERDYWQERRYEAEHALECAKAEAEEQRARKDGAYEERNRVVAWAARMALALGFRAGTARTAIEGWSEDWHGCVYIELPDGQQASWHYHDSQAELFADLPPYDGAWDGHTTDEKYARLHAARYGPACPSQASAPAPDADGAAGVDPQSGVMLEWTDEEVQTALEWSARALDKGGYGLRASWLRQIAVRFAAQARAAEALHQRGHDLATALTEAQAEADDLRARLAEAEGERATALDEMQAAWADRDIWRNEAEVAREKAAEAERRAAAAVEDAARLAEALALFADDEPCNEDRAWCHEHESDLPCRVAVLRMALADHAARVGGEGRDDGE